MNEEIMRGIFLLCYAGYMPIRRFFAYRVGKQEGFAPLFRGKENMAEMTVRAIVSYSIILTAWAYIVAPSFIAFAQIESPYELRLVGVFLALIGSVLLLHSHRALDRQWSPHLEVRTAHKLIATGPYAFVAHPMYIAAALFLIGESLISANLIFGALSFAMILFLIVRIPKEEKMLEDAFGVEYTVYRRGVL